MGEWGVWCARPSPLGNPYRMMENTPKYRDTVCRLYEIWLNEKISEQDKEVVKEFEKLDKIYQDTGELTLLCWCAPLRCHCETIRRHLEHGSWKTRSESL